MIRLRAKLTDAAASVKGLFGVKSEKDQAVQKLEALKVRRTAISPQIRARRLSPASAGGDSPQSLTNNLASAGVNLACLTLRFCMLMFQLRHT